jgi:hypothetical protein
MCRSVGSVERPSLYHSTVTAVLLGVWINALPGYANEKIVASGDQLDGKGVVTAFQAVLGGGEAVGEAAVLSELDLGMALVLFRYDPQTLGSTLDDTVKPGDPVPGAPDLVHEGFTGDTPVLTESGEVYAECRVRDLVAVRIGVCHRSLVTMYSGSPAPGTTGIYAEVRYISASNPLIFVARLLIGPGVSVNDDTAIWIDRGDGAGPQVALREGSAAPGLPAGPLIGDLGSSRPQVNASGSLLLAAALRMGVGGVTAANDSVFYAGPADALAVVAREGELAPGTSGVFDSFPGFGFGLNGAGDVAFLGRLKVGIGGVTAADAEGVWKTTGDMLELVARAGAAAAGMPEGVVFQRFGDPVLNPRARSLSRQRSPGAASRRPWTAGSGPRARRCGWWRARSIPHRDRRACSTGGGSSHPRSTRWGRSCSRRS